MGNKIPAIITNVKIKPKIILTLGEITAQILLNNSTEISMLRGKIHFYVQDNLRIPLVTTYHPRYLLNNIQEKSKTWDDIRLAWRAFNRVHPEGNLIN